MPLLTSDQEQAMQAMLQFLNTDNDKCFVLKGSAGTGKTFLIQHVQEAHAQIVQMRKMVQASNIPTDWVFTATTHKAAHALSQATGTETFTIHSLLKLVLKADYSSGTHYLTRSRHEPKKENLVIVIDEASYIDYQLLNAILDYTDNCKIIFMGDPMQLTPIGLNHSPVFLQNFPTASLLQVVRQQDAHPLTPILQEFRAFIGGQTVQFPRIVTCPEITHLESDAFEQAISQEFNETRHSSKSRLLAWRNKTVHKYNKLLFENNTQRTAFIRGDCVVNNHALKDIKTDVEVEILKAIASTSLGVDGHSYVVDTGSAHVAVFVPNKPTDFVRCKNKAIKDNRPQDVRIIMDNWADLRPIYASTVNKAQGSTYDKVFIDLNDFKYIKDREQLARLLYVAMSRARYQVIFTGDL